LKKNILLLGHNSYVGRNLKFYFKEQNSSLFLLKHHFLDFDILNLSEKDFYIKYFYKKYFKLGTIVNLVHIHKQNFSDEVTINKMLINKIIFFKKISKSRLIFFSSVNSAYDKSNKYAYSKKVVEDQILRTSGYLIIRPSTIIQKKKSHIIGGRNGKSLDIINNLIKNFGIIPIPGNGKFLHTVCFVKNLCNFVLIECKRNIFKNKIINFFSGEYITYKEFLDYILTNYKKNILYIPLPVFFLNFCFNFISFLTFKKLNIQLLNNLLSQKIEFDYSKKINEYIKLEKILK
jgi:nucleoside-diphosphate-sugar epimerase